jgi:hypothetical protein
MASTAATALAALSFALVAPAAQAADPGTPAVDLSSYSLVGRYPLPEPSNTTPPDGTSLLAQEASSVTYDWDTDTLFVVGDGGTSVVQVSKTGHLIDSMTLAPGDSPQGTTFYDTEAITYVGNGQFVLGEERSRPCYQGEVRARAGPRNPPLELLEGRRGHVGPAGPNGRQHEARRAPSVEVWRARRGNGLKVGDCIRPTAKPKLQFSERQPRGPRRPASTRSSRELERGFGLALRLVRHPEERGSPPGKSVVVAHLVGEPRLACKAKPFRSVRPGRQESIFQDLYQGEPRKADNKGRHSALSPGELGFLSREDARSRLVAPLQGGACGPVEVAGVVLSPSDCLVEQHPAGRPIPVPQQTHSGRHRQLEVLTRLPAELLRPAAGPDLSAQIPRVERCPGCFEQ